METNWQKELNRLITQAQSAGEVEALLEALLTPVEYEEVVKRWQIVKLLMEGKTQRKIRDQVETSIATVTRGSRELKYGSGILQKFYHRLYPKRQSAI